MSNNSGLARRVLLRLLQIDVPVPQRSDEEVAAEQARNYRWNFMVNTMDVVMFWFGLSFISTSTILPLFISKLTSSTLPIGLMAVISQGGWFLPQLFTANAVERLARKKPVVVNLGIFAERLPVWGLVVAALLARRSPTLALVLLLLSFAWHTLGAGLVATSWQDMVARCFPVQRRGMFWGVSSFIGIFIGVAGSIFGAWMLKEFAFPTNFVYAFAIAAASIACSWFFLALTREPVQAVSTPPQSDRQFWAGLAPLLRADHNFRRFMLARIVLALGGMGANFVAVAAVQRWGVSDSTVGTYTTALLLGQALGNLAFGLLADRFGHKLSLELGAGASCLSFTLAWLAPSADWYYLVFALSGVSLAAIVISGLLVVMEFGDPARRPTYLGLANTGTGLAGMMGPMLGALLASWSYDWLFALSAGVNLAALAALRWWVREPRWASGTLVSAD